MRPANNRAREIVENAVEAHGGAARWRDLAALEANISARGLLFTFKRRPVLNGLRVRASTRKPKFTFYDFPRPGQTGELLGKEEVRITDKNDEIVANRLRPRLAFGGLRRQFYWDDLDFIYFGGYATWNYLMTPFLFLREDFQFEALDPLSTKSGWWLRLRVSFPDDLPTHCKTQIFYFDQNYLLRRLDYTAEVVGRWARAAQLCENHRKFDGFSIPTKRRIRPLLIGTKPLSGPTLVAIDVHDVRPLWAA